MYLQPHLSWCVNVNFQIIITTTSTTPPKHTFHCHQHALIIEFKLW